MEKMLKRTDIFLTHTWRTDLEGRDNHQRVTQVNEQLNRRGFVTWFDKTFMVGDIRAKMAEGVDFSSCALIFVTEEYMKKIDSRDFDNCKFEYQRAITQKTEKGVLCVVMESKFSNPDNWFGRLKTDLGKNLFISMTGDLNDKLYLNSRMNLLVEQLKLKNVTPSQIRKECPSCKIYDEKTNTQVPLYGEGFYCTICKSRLVWAPEARYYCGNCNLHRHGRYCSDCEQDLINPHIIITEIENQYLKEVKLKTRLDLWRFPPLANKYQQEIESAKIKLKIIQEKRSNAHSAGTKLFMDDTDFARKAKAIEEAVANLKHTSSDIPLSAVKCSKLENSYIDEFQQLQEKMIHLAMIRDEISQQTNDLSHGFNVCVENLDLISEQIMQLKSYGVLEETDDLPNQSHDKQKCECESCTFENELTAQMKLDGGRDFLCTLITDNKVQDVKMAFKLYNEILHLTDDKRLNLVMSLILQNGTVEMLVAVVGLGLQIETDELIKHFKIEYGQTFIQRLILDNKIDDLKQVISLYKDILLFKNNEELNFLMSLILQNGSVEMMVAVVRLGLQIETDELIKHFKLGYAQTFIQRLIFDNKIGDLKQVIYLYKDILFFKNNEELNFLMSLILQNGSVEMLVALVGLGLQIETDELIKHFKLGYGQTFIQRLIFDDNIDDLKQVIYLYKDILLFKNNEELNLLMSLSFEHGTVDTLAVLMERGLQMDADELRNQVKLGSAQIFIKKLIAENKIDGLKTMISLCEDMLLLTTDGGLNLLTTLTFQCGSFETLAALLDSGLRIDVEDLMKQIGHWTGEHYIQKLIVDNKTKELLTLISLCKETLLLTDENGLNLLTTISLQEGTFETLGKLMEAGLQIDNIELMLQMKSDTRKNFIKKLILDDKTKEVKQMATIWKDMLHLTNDDGSNLLLYLTFAHGTECMMATLLDIGFDTDVIMKEFQFEHGQTFIKNLIVANNIDDLVKLLSACKDILSLKNDVGTSLLISFILEYGEGDMLIKLVDTFFRGQADELMQKQMRLGLVQKFIRRLIANDRIHDVRLLVSTWKELVHNIIENGFNVLPYYTVQHGTLGMFNMLVEAGVNVDVTANAHNQTYLHYTNNGEIAQLLCQKHGDSLIAIKDAIGCTSFMKAYINNNIPVLKVIKPYVKSPDDEIKACESYNQIIQLYKKDGIEHIMQLIKKNDLLTMRTLLTLTHEIVHTEDDLKRTPFLYCSAFGTLDMLKMLLEFGSDVLHRQRAGWSALHLAVEFNDANGELIINHLCSHFPELNTAENEYGRNVFHTAGEFNKEDFVQILLQHKPPTTVFLKKSKWGDNPIDSAKENGNKEIVQMFNDYLKEHASSTETVQCSADP